MRRAAGVVGLVRGSVVKWRRSGSGDSGGAAAPTSTSTIPSSIGPAPAHPAMAPGMHSMVRAAASSPSGCGDVGQQQQLHARPAACGAGLLADQARGPRPPSPFPSLAARAAAAAAPGAHAHARHHSRGLAGRAGEAAASTLTTSTPTFTTTVATSLADALAAPRGTLARLDLSSPAAVAADLTCVNLMCEKVGEACVCRLAAALERLGRRQPQGVEVVVGEVVRPHVEQVVAAGGVPDGVRVVVRGGGGREEGV
jgi:hypothetical protein